MELDTHSVVPKRYVDEAIKFGVEFESTFPTTAKEYIVTFFQRLLLQSQKLKQGFLVELLHPEVTRMWLELLSMLENNNRKVLDIQTGSITFKMFCLSELSFEQLSSATWTHALVQKVEELIILLGKLFNKRV